MIVVLIGLLTLLAILIGIWYWQYWKYDQYLKQYPGPTSVPIFGHALYFSNIAEFLEKLQQLGKEKGSALKLQVGFAAPNLMISDPKLLEDLLGNTKILSKGNSYKFFEPWLGTGLLTSEPIKWKRHRKILTPSFHFQMLEQFLDTFNIYSNSLIDRLRSIENKDSVDIFAFASLCTLDVICETSMGTVIDAQKNGSSEYVANVKKMTRLIVERSASLIGLFDFLFSKTAAFQEHANTIKILHSYSNNVISSRTKELQETVKDWQNSENDLGIKERNTFLDALLKYKLQGGPITNEEIRQEVDTVMFAGHDTTAIAVSFVLYSIANHPEVQQKSVEELRVIFGDDNRAATHRDLQEMKYLEMVIKESLRLYPPIPMYGRTLVEDTEFNGSILPKGVSINPFIYGLHRDPNIYPDPDKFDPERFTPENQAQRSPYAYLPFSAGPRNCIGQKFALLELKCIVSKVLRSFELLPAIPSHQLKLLVHLTLSSETGIKIRLQERKW